MKYKHQLPCKFYIQQHTEKNSKKWWSSFLSMWMLELLYCDVIFNEKLIQNTKDEFLFKMSLDIDDFN